ncbi:MAG: hypothetical protein U1E27_08440, partial [Kiritimatiellia bacterium]|nr:hypothetical protein [Kiritimatiellia bacterium]
MRDHFGATSVTGAFHREYRHLFPGVLPPKLQSVALVVLFGLSPIFSNGAESGTEIAEDCQDTALQSPGDLVDFLRLSRAEYLPLLPPSADFILRQPVSPEIVPFAWANFPPELLKQLADRLEYEYSAPVYPLRVVEDAQTRTQHLFDNLGQWLFSLDAPSFSYDLYASLKAAFPQLYSSGASTAGLRAYESLFDPSRIELQIKLLPAEHLDQYLYVRERVILEQSRSKEPEDFGLRLLLDLEENLYFSGIRAVSGGYALDIAWPEGFTNRLDIYRATDLMDRDWRRVASLLETDGLDSLSWTHANPVPSVGFYAAGNADLDSDQDGLSDAFEIFVLKTDPEDPDSFGVRISGTASYAGNESGPVIVSAELQSNAWTRTWC